MPASHFVAPHFKTFQDDILFELEKIIIDKQITIESWFRDQWLNYSPLLTCSVDLRNSQFKLAPVDTNVFPSGFNNLNSDFWPLCIQALIAFFADYPHCKNILMIVESHTRNAFYKKNIQVLKYLLTNAGFRVKVSTLKNIHREGLCHDLKRFGDKLVCHDFTPDVIFLNDDLSDGVHPLLKGISQPILPSACYSWARRSKFEHFKQYEKCANELSTLLNIDPWLIMPLYKQCSNVDFMEKQNFECLIDQATQLFEEINAKYQEHNITSQPFIVVKSDTGTYGMAVMTIKSIDELKNLNRKKRSHMDMNKGGKQVKSVLLQEGVFTIETMGPTHASAEPVIYMIGQHVIGGFYRVNKSRSNQENLNSPGMHFEHLAFEYCCNTPDARLSPHDAKNKFYAYSVIARLASLATLKESLD